MTVKDYYKVEDKYVARLLECTRSLCPKTFFQSIAIQAFHFGKLEWSHSEPKISYKLINRHFCNTQM